MPKPPTKKVRIPNPVDESETLRVTFQLLMPERWSGICDEDEETPWDEDESNIDINIRQIEKMVDEGIFEDVSLEWVNSPILEEVEELVVETYVEKQRTKYADRIASRW
jgi:hypothetical protein